MLKSVRLISIATIFLLAGCGGNEQPQTDGESLPDDGFESETAVNAPTENMSETTRPLTVDDIDRWQRGMQAELDAVEEAGEALREAETGDDTLSAMMAANDMSTLAAGASAAGVGEDRYRFIRSNLSEAVKYLTPLEQEMDTSQMPEAMVEQFEHNRQESLARLSGVVPPEVLEALRSRASDLRKQDADLAGARLRASGIGV